MTRADAIAHACAQFDNGAFFATLSRRVAYRSESQGGSDATLAPYLTEEMMPALAQLGFTARIVPNPVPGQPSFLVAHRHESDAAPTVLMYGHGDVVRGYDEQWRAGLSPWLLRVEGERWYGRGTADNKGQHSINLAAARG
jgi:acetylornithine deacetylase/succinyl-diaminopimelate desuccinylase-like protein